MLITMDGNDNVVIIPDTASRSQNGWVSLPTMYCYNISVIQYPPSRYYARLDPISYEDGSPLVDRNGRPRKKPPPYVKLMIDQPKITRDQLAAQAHQQHKNTRYAQDHRKHILRIHRYF